MRYGLLVFGLALCLALGIGLTQGWLAQAYDHVTTAALSADARLAIDVRCGRQTGRAADQCRTLLTRLYFAGSLQPDTTLRAYCDSVKNGQWGGGRPAPPALCIERYGGWPQS
jgi:hypothetical protein